MAFTPTTCEVKINGKSAKVNVAQNWKLLPVSGLEKVNIVFYDDSGNHLWETSPIEKIKRFPELNGCVAATRSGSMYLLEDATKHVSLWPLNIRMRRPALFDTLKDMEIL